MSISTTISKTAFDRIVMTTGILAKLAAGLVLLAGMESAQDQGGGNPALVARAILIGPDCGIPSAATSGGSGRLPIQNGRAGLKQD